MVGEFLVRVFKVKDILGLGGLRVRCIRVKIYKVKGV